MPRNYDRTYHVAINSQLCVYTARNTDAARIKCLNDYKHAPDGDCVLITVWFHPTTSPLDDKLLDVGHYIRVTDPAEPSVLWRRLP